MGGFFNLFYFNHSSMAKKILSHRRRVDGLEAPRNSLELQIGAPQSYFSAEDDVIEEDWSEKTCYPIEASMKRLINEEISKQSNTRRNSPSIVARLMGVDMLPTDTKSIVQPVDKKNASVVTKYPKREKNERSSVSHLSLNLSSSRQMESDSVYDNNERGVNKWSNSQNLGKPRSREHPQEEELQKFKKEFEAWQAARFKECSKVVELDSNPEQLLSQQNTNQQKMLLPTSEKPIEHKGHSSKARSRERASLHHRHKLELFPSEQKDSLSSRNKAMDKNYKYPSMNYDQKFNKSSVQKKIVILKPGPDRFCDPEESWTSSSCTLEDRGSIEDFLEEVKERLKCELQGKTLKNGYVFSEKPSDPKEIAKHIAKHVRESVKRNLDMDLLRSESTGSYRSEIQFSGPEFINRDIRRFSSEKSRNISKRNTHSLDDIPLVLSSSSESSLLDNEKIKHKEMEDTLQARHVPSFWEIVKDEDMQTRSFRHGFDDGILHRESSPRNLIRSLSAPVSGTSFGKLLLEDRHILTGAHIRRKHEALENVTMELKKRKKERFNIKEKVSNFKYSFTNRGKLIGKKLQSMIESHGSEQDFVKDMMGGPTVIRNLSENIMENSTEVPPSPASVCSSTQEELWRPVDYLSPVSTPGVTTVDDSAMPQVFREISSNLIELRRQLNQLESNEGEKSTTKQEPDEYKMDDLEDKVQSYIRDLLIASGLYDSSCDKCFSRCDPFSMPISNPVFKKVEESYRNLTKDSESCSTKDHKMVYDLLNEALSMVLGPPVTMSRFKRKIISCSMLPPLQGRKLLECVWKIIQAYLYPPDDKSYYSLDSLVARYLEFTPWSGFMDEEVNSLGKNIEFMIMGDLMEEMVKDIM